MDNEIFVRGNSFKAVSEGNKADSEDNLRWTSRPPATIAPANSPRLASHPLYQGFDRPRGQCGRPVLAEGELAAKIIARVDRLSRPYGVTVCDRDGIGVVTPP